MLTSDLTGNMGDFLRDYALIRCIAEKNGYEWGFNRVPSHDYYNGASQLDFMEIDYGKEHNTPWGELPEGITNIVHEPSEPRVGIGSNYNYHRYAPELFDIPDNTKIVMTCMQNFKYFQPYKEKIRTWFKIKDENIKEYEKILQDNNIILDNDMCILNARGGEYLGVPSFTLVTKYWQDAVNLMLQHNPNMKFMCITDDVGYYSKIFPFTVAHFSIGCDYYILNQAKNLIISNSGFAMFPTWLNENNPYVIAPLYWGRFNVANEWCPCEINIPEWNWMNREGVIVEP